MKKIIATLLCLSITTPCFAAGRYVEHYPVPGHNEPRFEQRDIHHNDFYRERHHKHLSNTTKTLGIVAGVAGVAMLISAVTD